MTAATTAAPPEMWARFFGALANETQPFTAVAASPVAELQAQGLSGAKLREAVKKELVRRREVLRKDASKVDTFVSRWRELRGSIEESLPDAAVVASIERQRQWLRANMGELLERTGEELQERVRPIVSTAVPEEVVRRLGHGRLHWDAIVAMYPELRVVGSTATLAANMLFLAYALPKRVLFRRCTARHCERVFFVEDARHRCCSTACTRSVYLQRRGKRQRIREQTRLRVERHRARKRWNGETDRKET